MGFADNQRQILKENLAAYGAAEETLKAIEEMGELTQVLSRYVSSFSEASTDEICSKIADVKITIEQLCYVFGEDRVNGKIHYKLMRQKERLQNRA